jgi:hypothetical protein
MALNLKHQTIDEFARRFREKYRNVSGNQCAELTTWLLNSFERGDFPELPFRTAFGHSISQWNSFKGRLNTLRVNYLAVRNSNGE